MNNQTLLKMLNNDLVVLCAAVFSTLIFSSCIFIFLGILTYLVFISFGIDIPAATSLIYPLLIIMALIIFSITTNILLIKSRGALLLILTQNK